MFIKKENFIKINDWLWEIPKGFRSDMRAPARIYASEKILEEVLRDKSIPQLINGATLPGITKHAIAMPDCHEGYSVPIGFVGAIRASDGIISPGACGFDINCLAPNSKILLENGCYRTISEIEKVWQTQRINFFDFKKGKLKNTNLLAWLKKYNNPTIYKITTYSGRVIEATEDHPIQTKEGMKETKFLKEDDPVLIYPFEGVKYETPRTEVILTEEKFKNILKKFGKDNLRGSAISQILKQLKLNNLLPLTYNHPKLPYILKIMGFIFGDGAITFVNRKKGISHFYGQIEDLKEIQRDIAHLGFTPSKIYSRLRRHSITTIYNNYKFSANEHSIKNSSSALAIFFVALGTPYGIKSHQPYRVPRWIFNCPLWQKRLFLASFFGAELSTPATLNKYNFYAPQFSVQKKDGLENNAKIILNDFKKLLRNFNVQSSRIQEVPGYRYFGKQGKTKGFRIQIKENAENLIRYFETIGYEYNLKKQKEACLAAHYLRLKLKIVQKGRRGDPRIAFDFPSFEEFKKTDAFEDIGLVWDKIEKIKKAPYADFVYDFTINDDNHNFIANNFIVSNCGMKLLKSRLSEQDIKPYLDKLAIEIQKEVPSGLGRGRQVKLNIEQVDKILRGGSQRLVEQGYGEKEDIENCEEEGKMEQADVSCVSSHAKNRGRDQIGTLGSGNHFIELQKVEEVFDEKVAEVFGLFKNQVVVMIHTGSRGLGHQVCTDYLKEFIPLMEKKYKINVPDREFACIPFNSLEGQRYFKAMAGAANYAWANRQMIAHFIRKAWKNVLGEKNSSLISLYDVAHNIIKKEKYLIDGKETEVIVHRKGATRAFPPNHLEIPEKYRSVGQPVLIPGSMGSFSYVLHGTKGGKEAFYSTSHGAGRIMSRNEAMRRVSGQEVVNELKLKGIIVKCQSIKGIAEEAPLAYKDIHDVVEVVHQAGLSKKVAKLIPLAVIKGE